MAVPRPDAAAVQLRKTLAAAAKHVGVDKPFPLVKAIQQLIDDGLITSQFGGVLGHIKDVGNAGAHADDKEVDGPTAERSLRFTVQVLRNLSEIPRRVGDAGRRSGRDRRLYRLLGRARVSRP